MFAPKYIECFNILYELSQISTLPTKLQKSSFCQTNK